MSSTTTPSLNVLITADQIERRVTELAEEISRDFPTEPLVLVGILKGSFLFIADLCRHLSDNVSIDFMQVSSYGAERTSSGVVQIRKDLDINIEGKHVLIVEDIVDSGLTLTYLMEVLKTRQPASLKVIAFLSKPGARRHEVKIDYIGFEIPDDFVVGYGLDDGERHRNLPYIAQVLG